MQTHKSESTQQWLFGELPIVFERKPSVGPVDCNEWVRQEEHSQVVRRLKSDEYVVQASGKPFKSHSAAQKMQIDFELYHSHEIVGVEGGFKLKRLSIAAQSEKTRIAEGRETWMEAQSAVLSDMGVPVNNDGEYEATEAQWTEITNRVNARLDTQIANAKMNQ